MMPIIYVNARLKKIESVCQLQRYRRSCSPALPKSDYKRECFESTLNSISKVIQKSQYN